MPDAAIRGDLPDALRRLGFPIAVVDSEGRIVWQNDSMRGFVGERVGRMFGEPVVADDRQAFREKFLSALLRDEPIDLESRLRGIDGNVYDTEISAAPLREHGRAVGIFGVFNPMPVDTEVKPANVELTPRQRQVLAHLTRGCSTAQIAHDLGISQETVRNHLRELFRRLGVHSRVAAVVQAHERGLV